MTTFIQHMEERLADPRYTRGLKGEVIVSEAKLRELLHHFHRLDSEVRKQYVKEQMNQFTEVCTVEEHMKYDYDDEGYLISKHTTKVLNVDMWTLPLGKLYTKIET